LRQVPLWVPHKRGDESSDAADNDTEKPRTYLPPCPAAPKRLSGQEEGMQANQAQSKNQEKLSFGALMFTIVLSNIGVFLFIAPYT
jgi:hypothetical protein